MVALGLEGGEEGSQYCGVYFEAALSMKPTSSQGRTFQGMPEPDIDPGRIQKVDPPSLDSNTPMVSTTELYSLWRIYFLDSPRGLGDSSLLAVFWSPSNKLNC